MIEKILASCIVLVGGLCPAMAQSPAGGRYPSVRADQVVRLRLEGYDTPDGRSHEADFEWTFSRDGFVVKKGKGAIPADLSKKLLSEGVTTGEIRGKWALENGGQDLVLTGIKAGDTAGKGKVTMVIEQTGAGIFRVGSPEYRFGLKDAQEKPAR
ncbi:MAG: hypothetical protein U0800_24260 [Isosphaeraceae bacterium]